MNWIKLALALLQVVNKIINHVNESKAIKKGEDEHYRRLIEDVELHMRQAQEEVAKLKLGVIPEEDKYRRD